MRTCCPQVAAFSRFCQTAMLSHLALPFATQLPLEATHKDRVLPNLLYLLSCLPHFSHLQASSIPTSSHPLIFHLSLLHCALHHYSKLAGTQTPGLSLFSSSLSLLSSFTHDCPLPHIVSTLKTHVLTTYSNGPVLESLVSSCLDSSTVVPGGSLTLTLGEYGVLEVVTPGPGVPLTNYGDHVMGMMSSDTHKTDDTLRCAVVTFALYVHCICTHVVFVVFCCVYIQLYCMVMAGCLGS